MFVDYYKILEIEKSSTQQEIKVAFRKQAIKWHPDKNPGIDVNEKMQLINEAYLILKDEEARNHYDIEYIKFYNFYLSILVSVEIYNYAYLNYIRILRYSPLILPLLPLLIILIHLPLLLLHSPNLFHRLNHFINLLRF